jgi:SAM-dependent methyltransferase
MNNSTSRVRIIRAGRKSNPSPPSSLPSPFTSGDASSRRVLHTGCGASTSRSLHPAFRTPGWKEIRLDINPDVAPDLVGSIVDMREFVPDGSVDAVWCSHSIEHLYEHETPKAFTEFKRVLKNDGFALLTCPDLEEVVKQVAQHGPDHIVYTSPAGPIRGLDMLFGYSRSIADGNLYMAHHTGFTLETMGKTMVAAGFAEVRVAKGPSWDLWAIGLMPNADLERLHAAFSATDQRSMFDEGDSARSGKFRQTTDVVG